MVKRPALWYYGGKWKVAPKILEWFPPHKVYVEPFGGAASVLLRKDPSDIEVYNDVYDDVVNFFRVMRDQAGDLLFRLYYTPRSREEYRLCLEYNGNDPVELARTFFVRSWQGWIPAGRETDKSWRNTKVRVNHRLSIDQLMDVIERLRNVYIECLDFRDVLVKYDTSHTLFYVDPPYIDPGDLYVYKMSEQDHVDLASALSDVDGYVVVSALRSELYEELYWDWIWEPLNVLGLMSKSKTEFLIMNYSL